MKSKWVKFGDYKFECVDRFKYLGLIYDRKATSRTMVQGIHSKATKTMYWLIRFVQTHKWNIPHMRLVLADVYIRSILQFGSAVWAPSIINFDTITEHSTIKPLCILYRKLLRSLLHLPNRTHNGFLYILSSRFSFQVTLTKLVYRYYRRLKTQCQNWADKGNKGQDTNTTIINTARWC